MDSDEVKIKRREGNAVYLNLICTISITLLSNLVLGKRSGNGGNVTKSINENRLPFSRAFTDQVQVTFPGVTIKIRLRLSCFIVTLCGLCKTTCLQVPSSEMKFPAPFDPLAWAGKPICPVQPDLAWCHVSTWRCMLSIDLNADCGPPYRRSFSLINA